MSQPGLGPPQGTSVGCRPGRGAQRRLWRRPGPLLPSLSRICLRRAPPPPRPLPCLHSSSLQFHAYIVSFTPAQSSLAQRGPGVPPPEINVLVWNISARRLEPEACQSRPFCPLRGASAMVGGLGGRGGERGQFRAETSLGPRLPPVAPLLHIHPLFTKINVLL